MQDVAVFKALLEHEIKHGKRKGWRLDESGTSRFISDYFLLRDFHFGEHQRFLLSMILMFGRSFLTMEEVAELEQMEETQPSVEETEDWLIDRTHDRVKDFWYFTVVLCRQLQSGENRLLARDAYWLGAVDEVMGSLHGQRAAAEYEEPPAAPTQPD